MIIVLMSILLIALSLLLAWLVSTDPGTPTLARDVTDASRLAALRTTGRSPLIMAAQPPTTGGDEQASRITTVEFPAFH